MLALAGAPLRWTDVVTAIGSLLSGLGLLFLAMQILLTRAASKAQRRDHEYEVIDGLFARYTSAELQEHAQNLHTLIFEARDTAKAAGFEDEIMPGEILRDRLRNVRNSKNPDDRALYWQFLAVADFFESVGLYVKYGNLRLTPVKDLMGGLILGTWELFAPTINDMRIYHASAYEWWEALVDQL